MRDNDQISEILRKAIENHSIAIVKFIAPHATRHHYFLRKVTNGIAYLTSDIAKAHECGDSKKANKLQGYVNNLCEIEKILQSHSTTIAEESSDDESNDETDTEESESN